MPGGDGLLDQYSCRDIALMDDKLRVCKDMALMEEGLRECCADDSFDGETAVGRLSVKTSVSALLLLLLMRLVLSVFVVSMGLLLMTLLLICLCW